jgi:hypothetical protein
VGAVLSDEPQPPEPGGVATQQDFGRELTLVRLAAGLTIRQVAKAAELPASMAGDYFAAAICRRRASPNCCRAYSGPAK